MFYFLCRALLHSRNGYTSTAQKPSMVVLQPSTSLRYLSIDAKEHSFTVSYLINTCGLSRESALSASKSVHFETPEKPDLTISYFKKLGFSKTQISEIIRKHPYTLSPKPEKTIFPKVEFFRSKGASNSDLVRIFTSYPWILDRSVENHLVPSFNALREFLQSEEKAIAAVKRFPRILERLEADAMPNINTLREIGVPEPNILFLVVSPHQSSVISSDKFGKLVEEVRGMGFNPLKYQFVIAVKALLITSKSMRSKTMDAYKRWGWSDEDIIAAFKKYPWCFAISEDKIMAVMDFYVNKLGLDSSVIANRPLLLGLSLKKRLIPRAAVLQYLSPRGQFKLGCTKPFEWTEKRFLEKFVNCHEEGPHLLKLYNEKLDLSE